jgi:outer membrane protein assembly factor BamB
MIDMKLKPGLRSLTFKAIAVALVLTSCSKQGNWTQFRGPDGNMALLSSNLPEKWSNDTNVIWSAALDGAGYSSPVIWGNKVFITSTFPEKVNPAPERPPTPAGPPPQGGQGQQGGQGAQPGQAPQPGGPQPGQQPRQGQAGPQPGQPPQPEVRDTSFKKEIYRWEVKCLDLKTGREIWKQVAYSGSPKAGKNPNSTYACETPVTDGKRVYAYFGMHGLYCYDMDGRVLWQKDLAVNYTQRGWGTGSSPILYNNVLYIQFDNEENSSIIALDAVSGNEKWRVKREEKTTYSTPYIWKNKIRTELVTCGKTARSYDPETGKFLWELKAGGEQVIPSPVGNGELLFIGNAAGRETKAKLFAVKAGLDGDITNSGVAWVSEESGLGNPSPLLYKGRLYVIGGKGEIAVLDAATGALKYQKRINGISSVWASPWANNDRIYFLDEKGTTRVFKAGDIFEQVASNSLEGTKFWSSVAVAGNDYIIKGGEKLYLVGQ